MSLDVVVNNNELLVRFSDGHSKSFSIESCEEYPHGHMLRVAIVDPVFEGEYIELMATSDGWAYQDVKII